MSELQEGLCQLSNLLKKGCFHLTKYSSNSREVLSQIPPESQEPFRTIDDHDIVKALGMIWQPESDVFRFTNTTSEDPQTHTKRTVLSQIAKLFDPLGLICPVTTLAKILFQSLWKSPEKLDWDTPLPDEYATQWEKFKSQLDDVREINIPRHMFLGEDIRMTQMHAFSDASEKAYGACI